MICPDAGPLGREIRHPGPQVGWLYRGNLLPLWAAEVLPHAELLPAFEPTWDEPPESW